MDRYLETNIMMKRRLLSTLQTGIQSQSPIPIVDFGRFLKGSPSERQATGEDVLNAFKNVGFVYLSNHSIHNKQVQDVFGHSKRFFDLPSETKNKLAWVSPEANRGYVAAGREKVSRLTNKEDVAALRNAEPDLKESLEIGKEPSSDFQNNWPTHDPTFRTTMLKFFEDCHALHLEVMDAIALGLGLSPGFFIPFCNKRDHNLRLLHYPSVPRPPESASDQLARAGAHTDYGSVTLLFQDGQGGLQVKHPATGLFEHAPPVPGAVAVNAGDMLSRWSNDLIRSTEHRVVAPPTPPPQLAPAPAPAGGALPARYSVAFFCNPNWDATIDCLDGCHSAARPRRYAPIRSHDYLVQRLSATYH